MTDLKDQSCGECNSSVVALDDEQIAPLKAQLHPDWTLDDAGKTLTRRFTFKGFSKAVLTANLAAFVSDKEGHHADIAFGWGYCAVSFTTHDVGGLSQNDFICAAKLDLATG
ncbi:4a-hydroxytetrahydrobiopterin dehydratase [Albirhodobacter sp. R86504]|uniref:4a-hydroxytetrahydrobiopterin dehydratase n=1 Tax=Albirhodobacter sp. R86504 TaxID=3093848 RepID=UPI003671CD86